MEPSPQRVRVAIAKYTSDLLRQEPRNVGVFLADGDRVFARFLGETEPGTLELSAIPGGLFNEVELYQEWYEFWQAALDRAPRSMAAGAEEWLTSELIGNAGRAFSVVDAGTVTSDPAQPAGFLVHALFDRLVAREEDEQREVGQAHAAERTWFRNLVAGEFRRLGILESGVKANENLFVRHPVRQNVNVKGTNPIPHRVDFYQKNGVPYLMEHVNFAISSKERARDHAMHSYYVLSDILAGSDEVERPRPIAIVNRVAHKIPDVQEYVLAALSEVPGLRTVYWDRDEERRQFLDERRDVAMSVGLEP
jgi:hypothetical protein